MEQRSSWRTLLSLVLSDRELYATFIIGIILLSGELAAPESWKLALRSAALFMLVIGLLASVRNKIRIARFLRADKHIPVVVAIDVPRRSALQNLELAKVAIARATGFDAFKRLEDAFNVHYEDLLAHRAERLPPEPRAWTDFLNNAQNDVSQFVQHVPGGCIYHVFIQGPSSLAFGVGALLGTKNRVIGYHYGESGRYSPVLDLSHNARRIKAAASSEIFQYISVHYPPMLTEDTALVLNLASHAASSGARAYLSAWQGQPPALVEVNNTYGGNLTVSDWVPVVQEVYQALGRLQRDSKVRRIHLFHSIPVPLALGIGMALGNFVPITVYNWEAAQSTYYPVLQLNQIESVL